MIACMKTKAAVYVEFGKPMVIDNIDLPDPGPTQVAVKLFASGICHSQLHQLGRPAALSTAPHPAERDYPRYVQWYRDGKLPLDLLVSKRYTLDQVNEGCDALAHGQIAGRAIIQY